ncbi:MAG: glycosyl transferase [Candidatus Electrothrix sp. AUS4]|nr:glycosyl transferase [Candidatus Electrothrix sp. AUS4]
MIPKKLHYIWFGEKTKPNIFYRCYDSWRRYCPDYEIKEWNLTNFHTDSNFFFQCIERKKYAFASDYARAFILYHEGGIYIDIDVELYGSFNYFLKHRAFSGFETVGLPFTAVWGAEAEHIWPHLALENYDKIIDIDHYRTNTISISKLLVEHWGVNSSEDETQILDDGIALYKSTVFCIRDHDSVSEHHFEGTWLTNGKNKRPFKLFLKERKIIRELLQLNEMEVSQNKYTDIEYKNLARLSISRVGTINLIEIIFLSLVRIAFLLKDRLKMM